MADKKALLSVLNRRESFTNVLDFKNVAFFDDKVWFYGSSDNPNYIRYSSDLTCNYIPEDSYDKVGDNSPITSVLQISDNYLAVFKENQAYMMTEDEEASDVYYKLNIKTKFGNVPIGQAIVGAHNNLPMVINHTGIYGMFQNENVIDKDEIFSSLTSKITDRFSKITTVENFKTFNHSCYTYFMLPEDNLTKVWVLDNRTLEWYYWELPVKVLYMYDDKGKCKFIAGSSVYNLTSDIYINIQKDTDNAKDDVVEYLDYIKNDDYTEKHRIVWKWESPPLTLNIINYQKKVLRMSFLFSDKSRELDEGDTDNIPLNNQLFYILKSYNKKSKTFNSKYTGTLDYVGQARIQPRLQKLDFITVTLTNKLVKDYNVNYTFNNNSIDVQDDDGITSTPGIIDKFNLIGITFKSVLSTGG